MIQKTRNILNALRNPEQYFQNHPDWRTSLAPVCALILFVTLLLVVTRIVGPADPFTTAQLNENASVAYANIMQNPTPLRRFLFPVYWAVLVLYATITRYLAVLVFGEQNRSFGDVLQVTLIGSLPYLLLSAAMGVFNQLAPYWWHTPGSALLNARIAISLLLLAFAYVWEAYICVAGFRLRFAQNRGRALVTWLAPTLGFLFCLTPILLFVIVSAR